MSAQTVGFLSKDRGLADGDGFALARQLTALTAASVVVLTALDGDTDRADEVNRTDTRACVSKADLLDTSLARCLGAQ